MQFVNSISPLSREGLILAATIVASIFALWLWESSAEGDLL